jgi:hypothetical protein
MTHRIEKVAAAAAERELEWTTLGEALSESTPTDGDPS